MSRYLDHLQEVADQDVRGLLKAEKSYGDSWKKRGGVGAFMMLARKWDRIENRVMSNVAEESNVNPGDIFLHVAFDRRAEGLADDIRDLRRYLLLVEAEMMAQGQRREEVEKE